MTSVSLNRGAKASTSRRSTKATTTTKATTIVTRTISNFSHRVVATTVLALITASGCRRDDSNVVRGRGLTVMTVPAASQANIYEAAARAAFDVSDPALSLLLDRRELPRTPGLESEGQISAG